MSATLQIDTTRFNAALRELHERSKRSAVSMVGYWGRKLLRKAAYATPIARGRFELRGRARAGWWPAAAGLGVTNVYTPLENRGEGLFVDGRRNVGNPSVTLENRVPYIGTMTHHGTAWWDNAVRDVEAQMLAELEKEYQAVCAV